jgi:hypothetical protein
VPAGLLTSQHALDTGCQQDNYKLQYLLISRSSLLILPPAFCLRFPYPPLTCQAFALASPQLAGDYRVPAVFAEDLFEVLGEEGRPDYR